MRKENAIERLGDDGDTLTPASPKGRGARKNHKPEPVVLIYRRI